MLHYVKVKGCNKCGGDLVLDESDWRCWQCGHYYYPGPPKPAGQQVSEPSNGWGTQLPRGSNGEQSNGPVDGETQPRTKQRRGYGARSARNINAVIRAKKTSDDRWWARNRQIIEYLDQDLSIREIATKVGLGERQVRVVRERLLELRAASDETAFARE